MSNLTSTFGLFGTASFIVIVASVFFYLSSFKPYKVRDGTVSKLVIGLVLGILAILGTLIGTRLEDGTIINVRELAIMIAGVSGGPIAGLLAGLIGGFHRYTVGGVTALPCTVSTILVGLISGIVSLKLTGKSYLLKGATLSFIVESGAMGLILVMVHPFSTALNIVGIIAAPMIAANTVGLIFWLFLSKLIEGNKGILTMGKKTNLQFLVVMVLVALSPIIVYYVSVLPNEQRVAVVSGHPDWKPIMYRDSGNIVGIGSEVTRMVFKDINVKIDSKYVGTWDVVQAKAKTGEIDAIVALYKTEEREEYLYYSIPYAVDPIVLFFNSGKGFTYSQKESLVGKKGVATIGDSYGQELDDFFIQANVSLIRVYTPEQAFALLKEGEVDYFIYSMYAGRKVIIESGLSGFDESNIVSNQMFYIGVSKKSPYAKYMNEINASLERLISVFGTLLQLIPSEYVDRETLFQVASFKTLSDGGYTGFTSYSELAELGDFGIGTFDGLDGEMIAIDGVFYQVPASGIAETVDPRALAPYATVTFFDVDKTLTVAALNYTQVKVFLDSLLSDKEAIYAIKISGTFEYAQTRSPQKQIPPYPPLTDALKNQSLFNFTDVSASAVGFWFPSSMDGVDYAGYHLHLITDDKTAGGHILDCIIKNATIEIDQTNKYALVLP